MNTSPTPAWICPVCGYIYYGAEPPEECPICATPRDQFEPYIEAVPAQAQPASTVTPQGKKIVICGAGIAGVAAAEAARKADPQAEITLISNEVDWPYYRMNLTRYLAGEVSAADLALHPQDWYAGNGITLRRETVLSALDLSQKEITLQDGSRLSFDKLVLAAGSHPFVPPFPGAGLANVTTLRTRQDADFILAACQACGAVVVIGGGLLGLETAGALARRGAAVTVLENQAWLLPRQLNQSAGALFLEQVRAMGINVRTLAKTRALLGEGAVQAVELEDGTILPAGLLILSTGIRSNLEMARQAGLGVNQGVLVDERMQTSHPDVFAAGDVAEYQGVVYGTWAPSMGQGAVAGANALAARGQAAEFAGAPRSNTLKVLGIEMFSTGQIAPQQPGDRLVETKKDGQYACFVFRGERMLGSILLGDTFLATKVKKVVESSQDCAGMLGDDSGPEEIYAFLREAA
jgi:nitrite reductase (NADH) large subunit